MAEPQTSIPSTESTAQQQTRAGDGEKRTEGERRSFENGASAIRKTGQAGAEQARSFARATAETGRQIAESSRRASREIADQWRMSLEPFNAIQMDMNRWLHDLWRGTVGHAALNPLRTSHPFSAFNPAALFGLPAADLRETENAYSLAIELPGMTRDDIDLSVHEGALCVCGHKIEEKQNATASYRMSERRFGRFERTFPVPADADPKRIDAAFRDGVLTITMPKNAEAAAPDRSRIEIK